MAANVLLPEVSMHARCSVIFVALAAVLCMPVHAQTKAKQTTSTVVAKLSLRNQTASIAETVLFTPDADALYRVSFYGESVAALPLCSLSGVYQNGASAYAQRISGTRTGQARRRSLLRSKAFRNSGAASCRLTWAIKPARMLRRTAPSSSIPGLDQQLRFSWH